MATIPFTNNYTDLSSNRGFQFKFFCEKCGNGYLSTFKTNQVGAAASIANAAASFLGGIFSRTAGAAHAIESMVAGPQHDSALNAAVQEIAPMFKQCTRCGQWVCEPVCWNAKAGLCETCAPNLAEEIASAQAMAARNKVVERVQSAELADLVQTTPLHCPKCGAQTNLAKFCPECGTALNPKKKCGHCGTEADGTPKFCPECGKPY